MATHACKDGGPCPIPPSPELVEKLRTQGQQIGQSLALPLAIPLSHDGSLPLSVPTGHVFGLNDGTIFPESHFETPVPSGIIANAASDRTPLRGPIKAAIVLVDFSDKPMAPNAAQRFQDLFFSTGRIATGSVTEYYADVSGGNIALTGQTAGPFRMPLKLADYAHGAHGLGGDAPNLRNLAADALTAVTGQIDFTTYDNDLNGYVDAFIVVHAGMGAEVTGSNNDIWSAKWVLPNEVAVNGVKVYGFLTIPEDALIGVCAHELGHLLFGWPDLYDIDYSSQGIAWCKVNQGWVNLITENQNHRITLGDVKATRDVRRLWKNADAASKEYFLIENRELIGFDQSLPGPGLLVWHVDDAIASNTDENHPKIGLMQADGLNQLKLNTAGRGDAGDPFPGSSNNTAFTAVSNPNSKSYAGADTEVSITNISLASQNMTMDIKVEQTAWAKFQLAPQSSISPHSDIAAVSRIPTSMELWWLAPNGSVQDAYWYEGQNWARFELAPAGSAVGRGITAVSRIPTSMEIWWISSSGSVEGAYWYEGNNWARYQLAPAGSASTTSRITAVSRIHNSMEVWWIAPNGSVQNAYWYEGSQWQRQEIAPGGSAALSGITALSRIPGSLEVWWVDPNGAIQDAYWYENQTGYRQFELRPAGSAQPGACIAAVSRIPTSMELWWVAPNGSVQDAYWYENANWSSFELAPAGSSALQGGIKAVSRIPNSMEVFWTGPNGSLQTMAWNNDPSGWVRSELAPASTAAAGSEIACVSRIPNSMEMWFEGTSGEVEDSYWYA